MTTLEQYADQCTQERLAKRISDDVLSFDEFDDDELLIVLQDIYMQVQS